MTEPLIAVMGQTCSGKTALAIRVAAQLDGEIVSCDSAAIFIGLDVGTAKPTPAEQAAAPHHLIDVLPPDQQWTAADFARAADEAIADIRGRGRVPILCGGTGLWMRALARGIFEAPAIDPEVREKVREELAERGSEVMHEELRRVDPLAASRIESKDPQRIGRALEVFRQTGRPISQFQEAHRFAEERHRLVGVAPAWPKETLWSRIAERTERMFAEGILEETKTALDAGIAPDAPGLSIIGYRDAVAVLAGRMTHAEAVERTTIETRQYAKRQKNWFNKEPDVWWVDAEAGPDALVAQLVERWRS
ncbi:MAG: tRNA (adenosine(37)-N6)-dimethylallyltransferase MiaA [Deltaproteobacteria bacterium]